jgi:putative tricarboxylic transport membrane protein
MARGIGGDQGMVALTEAAAAVGGANEDRAARPRAAGVPPPGRVRWARRGYLALAWVFAGCVAVQVFLAGMATFVDAARWPWHTSFIHAFEFLPLLMLPIAFLARVPAAMRWLTGALFALIWLQYLTANIGGIPSAFHPVNALVIFWVAVHLGQRAWRVLRQEAGHPRVAA